jgi:hypothetical protein
MGRHGRPKWTAKQWDEALEQHVYNRILGWLREGSDRLPADLAFSAGVIRNAAYAIEEYIKETGDGEKLT